MKWKLLLIITMLLVQPVYAKHKYLEKEYQNVWCNSCGGIQEYKLDDKTRVDCLLPEYAIEFDFANKWAESIGQSLYYGLKTNRKPAVVLIMENKTDQKYLNRLNAVAVKYGIKVFTMDYLELDK